MHFLRKENHNLVTANDPGVTIRTLVVIASVILTLGLLLQTIKMFKTKSAKDFSAALIIALLFSDVVWLIYGIRLHEWPIIVITTVNLPIEAVIVVGFIRYGLEKRVSDG